MQSSHRKRPRRLSATFVRTINLPGRYGDGYGGHGLSLLVKPAAHGGLSKSWAQAIRPNGRTTSIGLGAYPVVTLRTVRRESAPELTQENDMDPQSIEKAIKRCIDISTRLGALEDELPPAVGRVIVQCVDEIDEMQRWLEGRE